MPRNKQKLVPGISRRGWSPADVSDRFGVTRPTLFRWEREGIVTDVDHNAKGERIYGTRQLRQIHAAVTASVERLVKRLAAHDDDILTEDAMERLGRSHFFGGPRPATGILWLKKVARNQGLSDDTIRVLLNDYLQRPPGDELRATTLLVLLEHENAMKVHHHDKRSGARVERTD